MLRKEKDSKKVFIKHYLMLRIDILTSLKGTIKAYRRTDKRKSFSRYRFFSIDNREVERVCGINCENK